MIDEGTEVVIYPRKGKDKDFYYWYNARVGRVTCVNPIAGYKGYEVSVYDFDMCINVDADEVVKLK